MKKPKHNAPKEIKYPLSILVYDGPLNTEAEINQDFGRWVAEITDAVNALNEKSRILMPRALSKEEVNEIDLDSIAKGRDYSKSSKRCSCDCEYCGVEDGRPDSCTCGSNCCTR